MTRQSGPDETGERRPAIWLALSDRMTMREFLSTPFVDHVAQLCDEKQLDLVIVTAQNSSSLGVSGVPVRHTVQGLRMGNGWERSRIRSGIRQFVMRSANYRFDQINGFRKHQRKRKIDKSIAIQYRSLLVPEDRRPAYLGFPLSGSRRLLRALTKLRQSRFLVGDRAREKAFGESPPVMFIGASCQAIYIFDLLRIVQKWHVPTVGVVSSWDNLTLRGPVGRGFDEYWVWNQVMAAEAVELHGVPPERVRVLGCPLFDVHLGDGPRTASARVSRELDIPASATMILLAAYSARLGQGEPSIARHISMQIAAGAYGDRQAVLVIRAHPADRGFKERFADLADDSNVRLYQPPPLDRFDRADQQQDLSTLAGMIARSSVVVCGPGTVALDAACQDKPVINLRFDGDVTLPGPISAMGHYDSDHYDRFLAMGATEVVDSFEELDAAIVSGLTDPSQRAEARHKVSDTYADWGTVNSSSELMVSRVRELLEEGYRDPRGN